MEITIYPNELCNISDADVLRHTDSELNQLGIRAIVKAMLSKKYLLFINYLPADFIHSTLGSIALLVGVDVNICISSHIIKVQSDTEFLTKEARLMKNTPLFLY